MPSLVSKSRCRLLRVSCVCLLALLSAVVAGAQESEGETEPLARFHAAGLIGESHNGELNGFTFGGDIEFRLSRWVGVGFTGEHVDQPFRENVWFVPLLIHPTAGHKAPGLKLTVAPGFERAREAVTAAEPEGEIVKRGLWRVGVGYDATLKNGWTIGPDIAVDFVAGDRVLVYAVAVGREFGHR